VRGETFVTRKITRGLARIKLGLQKNLFLGNINALRDWGHAKDYVEAQWLMLQQEEPDDFVIATGKQYSVKDFINLSAKNLNLVIEWKGKGLNEVGLLDGKEIVKIDPRYFRPAEVENLLGDPTKAKEKLNWFPKISFENLVREMTEEDFKIAKNEKVINN
jgi:GDPmannose 4,6-dehydratase